MTTYPEALARHYDRDYAQNLRDEDVALYTKLAQEAGGPALEVGCGTGRVTIPIARAGIDVLGIDPSPLMREQLAQKLEAEAPDVAERATIRDGSFEEIPADGPFSFVCAPFRSIMHLPTPERLQAGLAEVARVLAPGGTFVFDTFSYDPEIAAKYAQPVKDLEYEVDGEKVVRWVSSRYDGVNQLLHATFEWHSGAMVHGPVSLPLRTTSIAEVTRLAGEAGLEIEKIWSDPSGTPATEDEPGDLFVFAKLAS